MFPSPVGELHFSILHDIFLIQYCFCFRPLSGNYISQLESLSLLSSIQNSFRPLSGNYISQFFLSSVYDFDPIVSVPCRGTTFLNKCRIYKRRSQTCFRPLSGNYISQYHPCNPATSLGSWSGLRGKNIFGKINKMHLLKSAANSVFKPCAAKSKQIFSFIKKYQFHIVPSYILFPDSGYISRYVVKPSFLYLYSAYDFVAHLFCQRYLLLFQYLLFRQT